VMIGVAVPEVGGAAKAGAAAAIRADAPRTETVRTHKRGRGKRAEAMSRTIRGLAFAWSSRRDDRSVQKRAGSI
jgi:hypothetical protein